MVHRKFLQRAALTCIATIGVLLVSACGGGGGASSANTPMTVRVVDGYVRGATVCLDANLNGVCDQGETQGVTDSNGNVRLQVPAADVGKYPLVAYVPATAVDSDNPTVTVGTAYTLTAPKDHTGVITPLTTLVQHLVEGGSSTAQAVALVQQQAGVTNPLADPVQTNEPQAHAMGVTLVKISQNLSASLAGVANGYNQDSVTHTIITSADVDRAVRASMLERLDAIAGSVPASCATQISASCLSDIAAAVNQSNGLAAQMGITPTTVATAVGILKGAQPDTPPATPVASASLKWLNYTDPNNWYYRMMVGSAADNTPDANGLVRYHDRRATDTNGVINYSGGLIVNGRTDDVHWNGTAWVPACTAAFENTSTVRSSDGVAAYNYCDGGQRGISRRTVVDYSGKSLSELVNDLRAFTGFDGNGNYNEWGTSDGKDFSPMQAKLNASQTALPSGSKLYFYQGVYTDTAWTYTSSGLYLTSAETAAGGIQTNTFKPVCVNAANQAFNVAATKLEDVVVNKQGKPCQELQHTFSGAGGQLSSDGSYDEWWDQSIVTMGRYCPPGATCLDTVNDWSSAKAFYTGRRIIAVAFNGTNGASPKTTYYACKERIDGGSARNCTVVGSGTYTITSVGGKRVMSFQNLPSQVSAIGWKRLLVESEGNVHWGYVDTLQAYSEARINLTAINALFGVLGIPAVNP